MNLKLFWFIQQFGFKANLVLNGFEEKFWVCRFKHKYNSLFFRPKNNLKINYFKKLDSNAENRGG